jgi:membrane protein
MFSLFPLALALAAAASLFIGDGQTPAEVVDFITQVIPVSRQLIARNVEQVLDRRGTIGFLALIGLIYSASGVFTILARNIGRAFERRSPRGFLKQRLVALAMVAVVILFLIISLLVTTTVSLLPRLALPLGGATPIYEARLWQILSRVVPVVFLFVLFTAIYRWVPPVQVRWQTAALAGAVATVLWQVASNGFTRYLSSGLVEYELIYGSLGAVIALMLWIYISSLIILFCAHLSAALERRAEDAHQE